MKNFFSGILGLTMLLSSGVGLAIAQESALFDGGTSCPLVVGADGIARHDCDTKIPSDDDSSSKRYISKDPKQCQVIRFACNANERPFTDANGCGCTTVGDDTDKPTTEKKPLPFRDNRDEIVEKRQQMMEDHQEERKIFDEKRAVNTNEFIEKRQEHRDEFTEQRDAHRDEFQTAKERLDPDDHEGRMELRDHAQEKRSQLRTETEEKRTELRNQAEKKRTELRMARRKFQVRKIIARIGFALDDRLTPLSDRIANIITKFEDKGADMTEAQRLHAIAKESLADAYTALAELTAAYEATGGNGELSAQAIEALTIAPEDDPILPLAKASVETVKKAQQDLVATIRAIKANTRIKPDTDDQDTDNEETEEDDTEDETDEPN